MKKKTEVDLEDHGFVKVVDPDDYQLNMGGCNPSCSPVTNPCSPIKECHPAQCSPVTQCGPVRR